MIPIPNFNYFPTCFIPAVIGIFFFSKKNKPQFQTTQLSTMPDLPFDEAIKNINYENKNKQENNLKDVEDIIIIDYIKA